jgi:chromosome segregation protein
LATYEDHPEGVKHLLLEGGMPEGRLGTLAERIRVPENYRRAIEAALGEAVVSLLVDSTDRAFAGMEMLRQREKGMVTFLPMNGMHQQNGRAGEGGAGDDSRILARANAVIECEEAVRVLVATLLDECYIVPSLTEARALLEQFHTSAASSPPNGRSRHSFVTLAGEVLTTWGPMRGGDTSRAHESVIDRKTQIEQLEAEVARLQEEIAQLSDEKEDAEEALRSLLAQSEDLLNQRKQSEGEKQKLELEFGQAVLKAAAPSRKFSSARTNQPSSPPAGKSLAANWRSSIPNCRSWRRIGNKPKL